MKKEDLYEGFGAINDAVLKRSENEKYVMKRRKIKEMKYGGLVAVIVFILLIAIPTGVVVNAATDGKILDMMKNFFGAQIVNEENETLIGQEVIVDMSDVITYDPDESEGSTQSGNIELVQDDSHIVKSIDSGMVQPSSIHEFQVIDGMTPEVIMTNGAAVIFYQGNYEGWKCEIGDKLIFDFSKYESEVVEEQTLVLGYILDGVMYKSSEVFKNINGRYELQIENAGEYYIYAISATSDYLTLRAGEIRLEN